MSDNGRWIAIIEDSSSKAMNYTEGNRKCSIGKGSESSSSLSGLLSLLRARELEIILGICLPLDLRGGGLS